MVIPHSFAENAAPENNNSHPLLKGKTLLDAGEYRRAVEFLTIAAEKHPLIADYALLWRARAYEKAGEISPALEDIRTIREKYSFSPLVKQARRKEITLRVVRKDAAAEKLFSDYLRDYPSDTEAQYQYALFLKDRGDKGRAKNLFREIAISATSLSPKALHELGPAGLSLDDMVKRGRNLNTAWQFREAEKLFRDLLTRDKREHRNEIHDGLAYSLFRQKRYKESAELYGRAGNVYWQARSLLRSGDITAFEALLPSLFKQSDKRFAPVLITYGTKKRREEDIDAALSVYRKVEAKFPDAKEDTLWNTAWTYYLSDDCEHALPIFSRLHTTYGESRYQYWKMKCLQENGTAKPAASSGKGLSHRDFYGFLKAVRLDEKPSQIRREKNTRAIVFPRSDRVEALAASGFLSEATAEIIHYARRTNDSAALAAMSLSLKNMGDYRSSVALAVKAPYSEGIHDLYYPIAHWEQVKEGASRNGLDPYLILAVIREESRYDPNARSIAGARGVMQLMPQTAARLERQAHVPYRNESDLNDPRVNILLGSFYLSKLIGQFKSVPVALAAYNAGEDAVKTWMKQGGYRSIDEFIEDIPFDETRNYVKKVLSSYFEYLRASDSFDFAAVRSQMGNL